MNPCALFTEAPQQANWRRDDASRLPGHGAGEQRSWTPRIVVWGGKRRPITVNGPAPVRLRFEVKQRSGGCQAMSERRQRPDQSHRRGGHRRRDPGPVHRTPPVMPSDDTQLRRPAVTPSDNTQRDAQRSTG